MQKQHSKHNTCAPNPINDYPVRTTLMYGSFLLAVAHPDINTNTPMNQHFSIFLIIRSDEGLTLETSAL